MDMDRQQVIFWLFIGIFSLTAIITLLGITNVIKVKYLKVFVTSLILEVVALVLTWGSPVDYEERIDKLWTLAVPAADRDSGLQDMEKLMQLEGVLKVQGGLRERLQTAEDSAAQRLERVRELERKMTGMEEVDPDPISNENGGNGLPKKFVDFYGQIKKLKGLVTAYDGSVNVLFRPQEKRDVIELMAEIFGTIELINAREDAEAQDMPKKTRLVAGKYLYFLRNVLHVTDSTTLVEPPGARQLASCTGIFLNRKVVNHFLKRYIDLQEKRGGF